MTKMFGIPMQNIMVTLLIITGICLSSVLFIAWRNRTMFWLGVRNLPRRKAQTTLIVFGLMLATVIITSALTIGDTLAYSIKAEVYKLAGPIDLVATKGHMEGDRVVETQGAAAYFDQAAFDTVRGKVGDNSSIDGLVPVVITQAPAIDETSKQSEPIVNVLGISPADAATLGGLAAKEGGTIDLAALKANEVAINASLATALGAKVGDSLTLFNEAGEQQ
ncbi:MAG: ABC transporter permease, partial [Thermomicrobiales bacterium]